MNEPTPTPEVKMESLTQIELEMCKLINSEPSLMSALYDVGQLPEQLTQGSQEWRSMIWHCKFFEIGMNALPSPELEQLKKKLAAAEGMAEALETCITMYGALGSPNVQCYDDFMAKTALKAWKEVQEFQ